jgi:hypothetical protein
LPRFLLKSEIQVIVITLAFQLISMVTLLRVATGVASITPTNTTGTIVVPTNLTQPVTIPNSTPQFVNPVGNGLSASLILALVFIGSNLVVIALLAILYRKKKMQWFSLIVSIFLVSVVTVLYFTFLTGFDSSIPIIAGFIALGVTLYAAFKGASWLVSVLALVVALELGGAFPVLLQAPLNWIIPLVYAVFDIYAVYFGRMGKLVKQVTDGEQVKQNSPNSELTNPPKKSILKGWPEFGVLSIRLRDIEIGMADIAFYTMVPGIALVLSSLLAFGVVAFAVDAGMLLSFTVFRKSEVAPGLPIPILLGLGALLLVKLLV